MLEKNLLCFVVLQDEEKHFNHALPRHENVEGKQAEKSNPHLIVALIWQFACLARL
jgi:hypothetical protein